MEQVEEFENTEEVSQESNENVTKVKMKSMAVEPEVTKVDLSKPPTDEPETKEDDADDTGVAGSDENTEPTQGEDEVQQEEEAQEDGAVLEEVTEEETVTKEEVMEALDEAEETGKPIPENVQKLLDFMDETGGDINDYVKLNRDVSGLDDQDALLEYYKTTKPHLSSEEISFLMEDQFSYDEDVDDERDIKRKKLARKEQVAEAKAYLDGQKSKYYEEIKAGSKLTSEQQKAIDFFNRYTKESKQNQDIANKQKANFQKKTDQVFNDNFKGFEYNVGDKKYRYNIKDVEGTKNTQSDINNFVGKFLDESNVISDAKGYHKGIFTAMNSDAIAQHFYEQGRADALKDSAAKAKNINTDPRSAHGEAKGGIKFKVLGDDSSGLKVKLRNRK